MSFWSHSPGPFWSHWFKSIIPCSDSETGLLNRTLDKAAKRLAPIPGTRVQELTELNAKEIETLLQNHYQTFPRSKLILSEKRIRDGFLYDGWMGVGVFTGLKLIGCAISRSLGTLHIHSEPILNAGLVDFFCVMESWRRKGIASYLLQELVQVTAKRKRLVHVFQKEGLPLSPIPPVWQSHYCWRKKGLPDESRVYLGNEGIATRTPIRTFTYTSALPSNGALASIPTQLSGDSQLYSFTYKGFTMNLCVTDTFHRSVPEGWRIGEISWILPHGPVPRSIQELAVEALVDNCDFEVLLLDASLPHQKTRGWKTDSPYGYYLFNYNPGQFFSLQPVFVL